MLRYAEIDTPGPEDIINHWNSVPNLPKVRGGKTAYRSKAIKILEFWIEEGYSVDELKTHIDKYAGQKLSHAYYTKYVGEEPKWNSKFWCPNTNWTIVDCFGTGSRFDKYYPVWEQRTAWTQDMLAQWLAKKLYG